MTEEAKLTIDLTQSWNAAQFKAEPFLKFDDIYRPNPNIVLRNAEGKEARIEFGGPEVTFSGDMLPDEAARVFFECVYNRFGQFAALKERVEGLTRENDKWREIALHIRETFA